MTTPEGLDTQDRPAQIGRPDDARHVTAEEVLAEEPLLRRVIAARVRDPSLVDDLVQDALEHLLQARTRLTREMIIPYGVVTARNLAVSHGRRAARDAARHPRLLDLATPEQPDAAVLRDEEHAALTAALARLPAEERNSLVAHHVYGTPAGDLVEGAASAATMRVRLARSRAKLRVEYLLSLRNVTLPTTDCRPTLLVLAGGDQGRRQSAATGGHLMSCATCASLGQPLIERRRSTAVLVPLVAIRALLAAAQAHPITTGIATATAAGAVAGGAYLVANHPAHPRPVTALSRPLSSSSSAASAGGSTSVTSAAQPAQSAPKKSGAHKSPAVTPAPKTATSIANQSTTTPSTSAPPPKVGAVIPPATVPGVTINGHPVTGGDQSLQAFVGQNVSANLASVQSVVTHDGFWVGAASERIWVELTGPLRPLQVSVGEHVSFVAPLVGQGATYANSLGVDPSGGANQLDAQGAHAAVTTNSITVLP